MRKLIVATLIAAMSVLGTAVPFASAKAVPSQAGLHPATSVVHSAVGHAPSYRSGHRVSSCFTPVPAVYGYGMEAILWECGNQFHTEAINQTGYTIRLCANIYVGGTSGWQSWCNGSVPNGYYVNSGSFSYCNMTRYEGAAQSSVWIYTQSTVCNTA